MVTIKKDTIKANAFEKRMIGLIKMVKKMEMPSGEKTLLLNELRKTHNECLEWGEPEEDFGILPELEIAELEYTAKAENL